MSQQLINRSPDLKRLRNEGYEIEVRGGYLLVHHVPYINPGRQLQFGSLVSNLMLAEPTLTARPDTHVIHFIGEDPCDQNGNIIAAIQHDPNGKALGSGIYVNRSFSNKPASGYPDYYQKVKRYTEIISAPAKFLDGSVTEKTFNVIPDVENVSTFQYIDTNASRANIEAINDKLRGQKVAIIGLGGTGAYILDLVAKTPVSEIHLYDGDTFDPHNAFRSPGAASIDELGQRHRKSDYYQEKYSKIHKFIHSHSYYVTVDKVSELEEMSFVFVCVDRNSVRKMITDYLVAAGVWFSDVGLGVICVGDQLTGALRVTTATPKKNDHLPLRIFGADTDVNDYTTNIQIAELNSINAALAVLKWKKLFGFYGDLENEYHSSFAITTCKILNEDAAS